MLARELDGTRVGVPRPVAASSGELVVDVDGGGGERRQCSLLTWVDGRELKQGRGLGPCSTALLGEALARIHDVAERFRPPPGFDLPRWDGETMFGERSPFRPGAIADFLPAEALAVFREVAEQARAVLARLDELPGSRGVTHQDFILVNCRFARRRGGWRVGVLDFDDLGWGHYLYDLAPLLGNLADAPASYPRLRRAFLAGYRSVRPLPPALEADLPVLMAARHAVALTWLAGILRRGETAVPVATFVEYRVEAMRQCLALA